MTNYFISDIASLIFLALAVSMDAFSISLSYGLKRPRLKRIMQIGILIGLFHMILPFIGIVLGQFISYQIGYLTTTLSGLLLIGIGAHMLFSAFNPQSHKQLHTGLFALISIAFIVSIDSFSIGLSLGMFGVKHIIALFLFGSISMIMTWSGFLLGRKIYRYIGSYSEILGGGMLISFGLHIFFSH